MKSKIYYALEQQAKDKNQIWCLDIHERQAVVFAESSKIFASYKSSLLWEEKSFRTNDK